MKGAADVKKVSWKNIINTWKWTIQQNRVSINFETQHRPDRNINKNSKSGRSIDADY